MSDDNPRAVMGGNLPPLELHRTHIDDLLEAARQFLDGEPLANQEQADSVGQLLAQLREARTGADKQRAAEKKPHDDAAKEVQQAWKPLIDKCENAEAVAKKALTVWLNKLEDERRQREKEEREKADALAAEAAAKAWAADDTDLSAKEEIDATLQAAALAEAQANRLDKGKSQAQTGGRAIGLRTVWLSKIEDYVKALKFVKERHPEELKAFLDDVIAKDVKAGSREIDGVSIWDEKRAA